MGNIDRGAPRGSLLSSCLYNIFNDTFSEAVFEVYINDFKNPAQLCADDVQLQDRTRQEIKKILDVATTWVSENGIKWIKKPGKSAVLNLKGPLKRTFDIAGRELYQT